MEAHFQLWKDGRRSDKLQGHSKIIKRRCDTARQTRLQRIRAQAKDHYKKNSAKAELCAAALGASESEGIVSLLKDPGHEMKPVLAVDAKATEHILHIQGTGRPKHIDVACLWMQDEV